MRAPRSPSSEFPNDNPELHEGIIWAVSEPCAAPEPDGADADADVDADDDADADDASDVVVEPAEAAAAVAIDGEAEEVAEHLEGEIFDESVEADGAVAGLDLVEVPGEIVIAEAAALLVDLPEEVELADATAPAPAVAMDDGAPENDGFGAAEFEEDTFTWLLRAMSSCAAEAGAILDLEDLEMLLCMGRVDVASLPSGAADALVAAGVAAVVDEELVASPAFLAVSRAWRRVLAGEDVDVSDCGPRTLDEWSSDLLARLLGAPQRADAFRRELRRRGVAAFGVLTDAA